MNDFCSMMQRTWEGRLTTEDIVAINKRSIQEPIENVIMAKSSGKIKSGRRKSSKKGTMSPAKATSRKREKSTSIDKNATYRNAPSPGSVSSKSTAKTSSTTSSPMSFIMSTPVRRSSKSKASLSSSSSSKKSAGKIDLTSLAIDDSSKKKSNKVKGRPTKPKTTKTNSRKEKTPKKEDAVKSAVIIDMSKTSRDSDGSTSSSSDSDDEESIDEDDTKELEAHQFEWHTSDGLMEGLSSHYDADDYKNKSTSQQIDMLVKKYTPAQLKPVFIMLSMSVNDNAKDLNLNVITTKKIASAKLKAIIVPLIDGDESDVDDSEDETR